MTFQVWLLFLVPHPHFWKIYARFPDEEFNTESIGTNLNPKNEKQKSLYALFYFLFFILFWGHFNKTMLFPFFFFFSQFGSQSEAEKLPSSNKKVLELSSKEKVLEQKEKKTLSYDIFKINIEINKLHCRSDQRWRQNFIIYLWWGTQYTMGQLPLVTNLPFG